MPQNGAELTPEQKAKQEKALVARRWWTAVTAALTLVLYGLLVFSKELTGVLPWATSVYPWVYGLVALLAFYLVSATVSGSLNPLGVVNGADGRPSTSKFQFFFWTAIVVFVYGWVFALRAQNDIVGAVNDFPQNVLLAMGFSVVTAAGAKGITVSYINTGQIDKTSNGAPAGGLFSDDAGLPDLTKIQMLVWTFIAGGVYLFGVAHWTATDKFPDIDGALMVLMGLGQGAYLGNKLVSRDTVSPAIAKLSVTAGAPGVSVAIQGEDLGATQGDSKILIDGVPLKGLATSWDDTQVTFAVPETHPNGQVWTKPTQSVQIKLLIANTPTPTSLKFDVTPPAA